MSIRDWAGPFKILQNQKLKSFQIPTGFLLKSKKQWPQTQLQSSEAPPQNTVFQTNSAGLHFLIPRDFPLFQPSSNFLVFVILGREFEICTSSMSPPRTFFFFFIFFSKSTKLYSARELELSTRCLEILFNLLDL